MIQIIDKNGNMYNPGFIFIINKYGKPKYLNNTNSPAGSNSNGYFPQGW